MGKTYKSVKNPARQQPDMALTKKQLARSRKEQRQLRIIWASVAAVAVIIVAILLFAVIRELLVVPNSPVATVNGNKISTRDFEPLLQYRRFRLHDTINAMQYQLQSVDTTSEENQFLVSFYQQQLQQTQGLLATAHEDALDELIEDELIRQRAQELALTVTPEEVDTYLHDQLAQSAAQAASSSVTATQAISVTPTAIPQSQLDEDYNNLLQAMGLKDTQFRRMIERSLLRGKLQEILASQVPTTGLVVNIELIQLDMTTTLTTTLETTLQRLQGGEDWATVAKEVSTAYDVQDNGGQLGWKATGQLESSYGTAVEEKAFGLEPGKIETVDGNGRKYIIRVLERDENGPLPEDALAARRDSALTDWLEEQKQTADIQRLLDPGQIPADPFGSTQIAG